MTTAGERIAQAGLDWIVPQWPVAPRVQALVTTRNGGVSTGARATLDVGGAAARESDVLVNRARLRAFLPNDPQWLHQVHGISVARIERTRAGPTPTADAAVTAAPNAVCAVRTADCLPVFLAQRDGHAVGVAHAGWRGLAGGVLEATLDALAQLGASNPDEIVAWLGPAIGSAAFEVGDEVRAAFVASDEAAAVAFAPGQPGKWHADLYALARQRLAARGIVAVGGGGYCTHSDEARFFSYRRSPETGRMAALIWIASS